MNTKKLNMKNNDFYRCSGTKAKGIEHAKKPKNLSRSELKARDFGAVGKSIGGKQKSLSAAAKNTEEKDWTVGWY